MTSAYGIFYEPYYTGQGGPLQSPISAPPYLRTRKSALAQLCQSLRIPFNGNPPGNGTFATPLTNLTVDSEPALALRAGLGLERAAILRLGFAV